MGTPSPSGSWEHIITQIGMFAYTGLTAEHVASLLSDHHVYLTPDGRMAICGLRSVTVPAVVKAMDAVLRADPSLSPPSVSAVAGGAPVQQQVEAAKTAGTTAASSGFGFGSGPGSSRRRVRAAKL